MTESRKSVELGEEALAQFDWLQLQKDLNEAMPQESNLDKLMRKFIENPLVPIGATATTMALCYGIWNFRHGRTKQSQYMMRTRVVAQGFTIAAIVAGYIYGMGAK